MSTPTFASAPTRFVCRGWTVGDTHYACLTPSRPHFREGQCAPCFETTRLGRKTERELWVSLNDIDLEGEAPMTALARMPDAAGTRVEVAPRRWSRDYAACQGWGAAAGQEHHACTTPEGGEFDQGRCYRCHKMHQGWLVAQQVAAEDRPAPVPRAITLTVPHADPAPTPASTPVPTPQEIVPRAWHKHYDCCVQCGTTEKKPASRGLCTTCYPPSTLLRYTGHAGPRLDRSMSEVEQRALVDAYLATITIPTPAAPTAHATPVVQEPTVVAPVPASAVAKRPWTDVLLAEVVAADTAALTNDDEPQWEVFAGQARTAIAEPVIVWRSDALLCIPQPTLALLGQPTHVELLYDAARRLVGLRPATATTPNARRLPSVEGKRVSVDLSIHGFVNRYQLHHVPFGHYPVRQFGPVVAIQLPPPTPAQP